MQPLLTGRLLFMIACSGAMAIVFTLLLTPFAMRWAGRAGAVAVPRDRDMHEKPVPRWGGLAIYGGFLVTVGLAVLLLRRHISVATMQQGAGIVLGATIVSIIGALDDRHDLPPLPRLGGQFAASLVAYAAGVQIELVNLPFTHHLINTHWLSAPFTVFWMLLVMNAINWLDGLDGLAAGVCSIIAIFLAVMAITTRQVCLALFCVALAGSTIGFLRYNYSPARIYMGGGAEFLGFVLAAVSVVGSFKQVTTFAIIVPFMAMAVPLIDSVHVVFRRWRSGEPVYQADQRHFHHVLVDLGLSKQHAVLVVYLITLVLCLCAWAILGQLRVSLGIRPAAAAALPVQPGRSAPHPVSSAERALRRASAARGQG